jgi:pentatricopeptide repeat protein
VVADHRDEKLDKVGEQIASMKKYASTRNIAGTMRTFKALQQSGVQMTSMMYNIVLQAWISCGNVQAAEDWLDSMRESGMADLSSFNILIKTLVLTRALDKASALLHEMKTSGIKPDVATFTELISGYAQGSRFHEGLALLENMQRQNIEPCAVTFDAIAKLLNVCRCHGKDNARLRRLLHKFKLDTKTKGSWSGSSTPSRKSGRRESVTDICPTAAPLPVPVPRLAAAISRVGDHNGSLSQHEVEIIGSINQIKSVKRTLKQHGFLDTAEENDAWPLNGHWETDHGLTVVIENKLVRWSRQRASRLRLSGTDRRSCVLHLYGEPTQGQLVTPGLLPGSTKSLRWANGDTWHSYDGLVIGQAAVFTQTMTKVLRDDMQDQAYRARSDAVLRCVSKSGLYMPSTIEHAVLQFLGNDLYLVRLSFESRWYPKGADSEELELDADLFEAISRRNPRVGLRHCWAEPGTDGCYGQRTLVNGEEIDEECFRKHVKLVWRT